MFERSLEAERNVPNEIKLTKLLYCRASLTIQVSSAQAIMDNFSYRH
jgi:hypothetical protein